MFQGSVQTVYRGDDTRATENSLFKVFLFCFRTLYRTFIDDMILEQLKTVCLKYLYHVSGLCTDSL